MSFFLDFKERLQDSVKAWDTTCSRKRSMIDKLKSTLSRTFSVILSIEGLYCSQVIKAIWMKLIAFNKDKLKAD